MDALPWDLQVKIYSGIGIDGIISLGIRPGKLKIPPNLAESIEKCMANRPLVKSKSAWHVLVTLFIAGTNKFYDIYKRSDHKHVDVYVFLSEITIDGRVVDLQKSVVGSLKVPIGGIRLGYFYC